MLVRGINNLSDARYCAGMGADGLIFTLDPSLPGAVTPGLVRELAGWVSGVELIGEFGPMPSEAINALVAECALSRVLVSFPTEGQPLQPLSVPALAEVIQVAVLDETYRERTATQAHSSFPFGYEFTTRVPADPRTAALFTLAARRFPLWLSGTISPVLVREIAETIQPAGLILTGGDEIKPGLRDFTELEAIFEALEAE